MSGGNACGLLQLFKVKTKVEELEPLVTLETDPLWGEIQVEKFDLVKIGRVHSCCNL